MSLIEEALRKHREEQAAQKPAVPPHVGAASTLANQPVLPETRAPSHRRMLLLGLNLLLVIGVLAAIVWGAWHLLKRAGRLPTAFQIGSGSVVARSGTTAMLTRVTATTSPQHTSNAVAANNRVPALLAATLTNGLATGVSVSASTSQPPAQVTALATPIPLPPPAPTRPVWPRLAVSGIMEAPGNRSTAIVNGKLLRQGETVQGATIAAITRHGVTLEFGGETRLIRTGNAAD